MALKIGEKAPDFTLPGVDGKTHELQEWKDKRVLVLVFTCNHCPYARAYEDRLARLAGYYGVQGVQFVAINSNDASFVPEDSFERMKARAAERHYPYPYLHDETQRVATAYGATVTPDCFVFDKERVLKYRGRVDDNWRDAAKTKDDSLKEAISVVLSGGVPKEPEKAAIGCSLKWKWSQ